MQIPPTIRFDHFAYPVDDLVKAEEFYTGVLEIPIYERRGLRVIDIRAGTLPRTFLNVAGSREPLPEDKELHGAPVVGIEVTPDGLTRIVRRIEENQSIKFDGPRLRERLGPHAKSFLLQDPFGNHLELIEADRPLVQNGSAYVGLSQLELEVTDLDRSVDFYTRVFALKLVGREKDALGRATACLQLHSGQWLIFHKVEALNPRSSAFYRFEGHYAFMTPTPEALFTFREAIAREGGKVDALEQTQVRSATAHGLYFTDYDGNPLQLQVDGSE
jgi:catechol 2,3-dioxygenase-like lactoylglutathione lyase family enzyme